MKKLITITFILLITATVTNAQCKAELKAKSKQNCTGIFLMDKEISPDSVEVGVVLRKDFEYGFYLFAKNGETPEFKVLNSDNKQIEDFKEIYNKEQNYRYVKFKAPKMGEYTMIINIDKNKKTCALFSFYLQTDRSKLKKMSN